MFCCLRCGTKAVYSPSVYTVSIYVLTFTGAGVFMFKIHIKYENMYEVKILVVIEI